MKRNVSFRKEKKAMKKTGYTLKKHSRFMSEGRNALARRLARGSGKRPRLLSGEGSPLNNPPKIRKGKTGTWIKAKAVKVTRVKGKLVVQVKR